MPPANKKNTLLVEGKDDLLVIPYLIEANGISWPRNSPPVWIKALESVDTLMDKMTFESYAKEPGLEAIGTIVDADDDAQRTWLRIAHCCGSIFPGIPVATGAAGFVLTRNDGVRFGAWIMPDNLSSGMMETFLTALVRPTEQPILTYAEDVCRESSQRGATFKMPLHLDKARMHTFLAWQDPPGHQLHEAVFSRSLDGTAPTASLFVQWFRTLYQV